MEKQPENPTPVVSHEESDAQALRPWHRPVLERLHISLDTAELKGSDTDGLGGSAV